MREQVEEPEKKKPEPSEELTKKELSPLSVSNQNTTEPARTQAETRQASETRQAPVSSAQKVDTIQVSAVNTHEPVIEKHSKSFSIKDLLAGESSPATVKKENSVVTREETARPRKEFSPESFYEAWNEFVSLLDGEGTRIVSMFKSIKPEFENERTIKIHLSNATQKDIFVVDYKPRLLNFLENSFILPELEIETAIDIHKETDILYTDEQKSAFLFNKYPVLKEMKKRFNLDIQ
jgi:DNA polymerase-3 subunit gamma/tau